MDEFLSALKSEEFILQVPINKREMLYERAMKVKEPKGNGYVTFQDFVNVVSSFMLCLFAFAEQNVYVK